MFSLGQGAGRSDCLMFSLGTGWTRSARSLLLLVVVVGVHARDLQGRVAPGLQPDHRAEGGLPAPSPRHSVEEVLRAGSASKRLAGRTAG